MPYGNSTKLSRLAPYAPSVHEVSSLIASSKSRLEVLIWENSFKGDRIKASKYGRMIIEAIASADQDRVTPMYIVYNDDNRTQERIILPASLSIKATLPGQSTWKGMRWRRNFPHLKFDAYQVAGFSYSGEEAGFKTFNVDDITDLSSELPYSEEISQEILIRDYNLSRERAYIIQCHQLRLADLREIMEEH